MKKNKSLIERLNKIGPSIEPCGTDNYLYKLFATLKLGVNQS